jgi:5-formaminoimidazole-4-carboxamide-1-(beta)-D-ribofuranosyl 5'-monophosphate synthetase
MVPKGRMEGHIADYGKKELTVATVCSHSSLQIFHGARMEGLKTLGICIGKPPKFYDAFPLAKPDEFLAVKSYENIVAKSTELLERRAVIIPTGSFVEYLGARRFMDLDVPNYGNRAVLDWESDRVKQREWLTSAGVKMPQLIDRPESIDRPVMVKYHGAKGGRGFFIAKDHHDFKLGIDMTQKYNIQEYILGTRYYLHYFHSPISEAGYRLSKGSLELMGADRRDETNADEMYKLGAQEELKRLDIYPSFVVTGNVPVVLRESLLPKVMEMGERTVEKAYELFGGLWGPFCLETIVNDKLEFICFEISARIVAGTNVNVPGSPYSEFIEPGMTTGRRIARELKNAQAASRLHEILT